MQHSSASERAFSIPEVLEAILLNCQPRYLLVDAQRVNRTWHSTVRCSPALQRSLFFEICPRNDNREPEFNPLVSAAFPPFFKHNPDVEDDAKWTQESLSRMDWNSSLLKRDAYSRKEASWRQMLVLQPPIMEVDIFKSWSSMTGMGKIRGRIMIPDGLKMGLLYDLVEEEVHAGTTFQSTDFDLRWNLPTPGDRTSRHASPSTIVPNDAKDDKGSVAIIFARLESWINIEREDYEPPDLTSLETEEEKREAREKAFMSNARPHMVSKARAPIDIEWGEEKNIRRWR
ncbi:hypothetical protein L207DRAFT_518480 [Hyaloscypha variabilis F]|uniref:F-box domain-containing protein n=1 Tax=Hyaloscypha variabilis (strain UAMH 11265 / GT02V1 / F) TaxID=1149755 RepID=A0A2J6R213_HYAVF|nr:hypothetical protein L207DRAFT_518480 [Hyaloscypha variabilis F]